MFGLKRTVTQIEVSAAVYDAIALAMVNAGATVAIVDGALDMRSVGIVRGAEPEPAPVHRPLAGKKKNTAPGAL